jgi:hypothetical protein
MKYPPKILALSLVTLGLAAGELPARAEAYAEESGYAEAGDESAWSAEDYETALEIQAAVARNKKGGIPGRAPRGGSSYSAGGSRFYSNGGSSYSAGSSTFYSNGGSSYTAGSSTFYSDGRSSYSAGSSTFYSDGKSCYTAGSSSFCSDGSSCYTAGSSQFCS